jgi:MoaA/NifB/PqqE/SkfB family radical SAM enzyme
MVGKRGCYEYVDHEGDMIPSGLKHLIDVGYPSIPRKMFFCAPFQVQCVISRYNKDSVARVGRFCKENGIYFFLETMIWDGRAADNRADLEVSEEECRKIYRKLRPYMDLGFFVHQKRTSCVLEKNPVVDARGDMRVCYSRKSDAGNIRDASLQELFMRAQEERRRQAVHPLKGLIDGKCFKTCSGRENIDKVNR